MNRLPALLLTLLATALAPALASAQQVFDADARAAAIAPYLDKQTFAVVHVDLAKVSFTEGRKLVASKLTMIPKGQLAEMETQEALLSKWIAALRKAGARELYVVASMADIPARPPFGVMRIAKDADVEQITKIIVAGPEDFEKEAAGNKAPFETAVIRGDLCLGHANTLARLKEQKGAALADLAQGFKVAGDTCVQAVFIQNEDTRVMIKQALPALPGPLSDYTGEDFTKIRYAALGVTLPPKTSLRLGIQADDEAAATKLSKLVADAFALGKNEVGEVFPKYDELAKLLTPKQNRDRLSLVLSEDNGGVKNLIALATPSLAVASKAAQRAQSANNLKQFALGMHNFHDVTKAFPPAASGKDGKSLLSWRVQILPYIEQSTLYDQFHHDEPWDSEHNMKLLEKMPTIYATPGLELKPGYTTYLVPTGKKMVFDGARKTSLADVTDGTSNTIMIVEADADKAVPWTKPDDLPIDLKKPLAGLGGVWENGFQAAFCDGSVHFLSTKIDLETLANLFQMNDGNPVGDF
jgi:hypothetical protein